MRKQSIPVSYMLKENKKTSPVVAQRKFIRRQLRETKKTIYNFAYPVLSNILVSGALTVNESRALTFYLAYRTNYRNTIPVLNDSIIRRISEELNQTNMTQNLMTEVTRLRNSKTLIKEQRVIAEGIFDFVEKIYDAGAKGVQWLGNAISSGWAAIKKSWGNFKELVSAAVAKIKDWFWKFGEQINAKVKSGLAWCGTMWKSGVDALKSGDAASQIKSLEAKLQSQLGDKGLSGHLSEEMGTFQANMTAIKGGVNKWMTGEAIATAAANPPDEVGKEVDQLGESVNRHMQRKNYKKAFIAEAERSLREEEYRSIKQVYKEFFTNKSCMVTLREMKITLSEGGAGHPEDIIKKLVADAPDDSAKKKIANVLHRIVKIAVLTMKWVFNPIVTVAQKLIEVAMRNLFKGINFIGGLKPFGGPGVGESVGMGIIMAEIAEIGGHKTKSIHHTVEAGMEAGIELLNGIFSFIPGIGTVLKIILATIKIVGQILYYYAIGTLIINVVPMIKALIALFSNVAQKTADVAGDVAKAAGA